MTEIELSLFPDLSTSLIGEMASLYPLLDVGDRTAFADPFFVKACWEVLGQGTSPFCLVGRENGRLIGVACFRHERFALAGVPYQWLVPIDHGVSDFTAFLAVPDKKKAFSDLVVRKLAERGERFFMPHVRPREGALLPSESYRWWSYGVTDNHLCYGDGDGFRRLYDSKKERHRWRFLEKAGRLNVEVRAGSIDASVLEPIIALHKRRWAEGRDRSSFYKPGIAAFYARVCSDYNQNAVPGNKLIVSAMDVDGELVAGGICWRWGNTLLCQIQAMNQEWSDYSPGHLLKLAEFRYADQVGITVVDLGYGNETYKNRYSSETIRPRTYVLMPSFTQACLLRGCKWAGRSLGLRRLGRMAHVVWGRMKPRGRRT